MEGHEGLRKLDYDLFKSGYLDESGDPGKPSKKGSSKFMVFTYVCTKSEKKLSKILNNAKKKLRRTKKGKSWLDKNGGEIKFYGFPDEKILEKVIKEISQTDLEMRFIAVDKGENSLDSGKKTNVQADIFFELLGDSFSKKEIVPQKIFADLDYFDGQKINELAVYDYEEYSYGENKKEIVCKVGLSEENFDKSSCNLLIPIEHENSRNNEGLQVVDLISGAIFREMENEDRTYTDIIRNFKEIKGKVRK